MSFFCYVFNSILLSITFDKDQFTFEVNARQYIIHDFLAVLHIMEPNGLSKLDQKTKTLISEVWHILIFLVYKWANS